MVPYRQDLGGVLELKISGYEHYLLSDTNAMKLNFITFCLPLFLIRFVKTDGCTFSVSNDSDFLKPFKL